MPRQFQHSYVVCTCMHVTLGEIIHAIKDRGASTIEEIGELTDAGTCCKSCVGPSHDKGEVKMALYLEEIVNKFVKN